jgi:RNA polymerase sigma factor (sigma-70 family)
MKAEFAFTGLDALRVLQVRKSLSRGVDPMADDEDPVATSPPAKVDLRDDPELLARFMRGERVAVNTVVRQYAPVAAAAISGIERDPIEANDILQDTLIALVERRAQYQRQGSYAAYVATVARNKALSALRKRKSKRATPLDDEAVDSSPTHEEAVIEIEEERERAHVLSDLGRFRASLPEDLRQVMDLKYGEAMGRPRIARMTGLSEKKVRGKMDRVSDLVGNWRARWRRP